MLTEREAYKVRKRIELYFPYDPCTIEKIKNMPNRQYSKTPRPHWSIPATSDNVKKVKDMGFKLDRRCRTMLKHHNKIKLIQPEGFGVQLYKHQREAVGFIEQKNGCALIADDMGLGKTLAALGYVHLHPECKPVLIVCPACVKEFWRREAQKALDSHLEIAILEGQKPEPKMLYGDIFIINYDIVMYWEKALIDLSPEIIICDEIHYLKNAKSKRCQSIKAIAEGVSCKIGMTGTPLENNTADIFQPLNIIDRDLFPSFFKFAHRYCNAKKNHWGWDFSGSSNADELNKILSETVMLRRRKEEVLKDLPKIQRSVIPVTITNRAEYDKAEKDFVRYLKEKGKDINRNQVFNKVETLRQMALLGKRKGAMEFIGNSLNNFESIVCSCVHTGKINVPLWLEKQFGEDKVVKLTGKTPKSQRQQIIDRFQKDKNVRIFVGQIKAAGVGITLTRANAVIFLEMGWTPGEHDQMEARINRIGQTADSVFSYWLIAEDTIEERILKILDRKKAVIDAVVDDRTTGAQDMLQNLIKEYAEK